MNSKERTATATNAAAVRFSAAKSQVTPAPKIRGGSLIKGAGKSSGLRVIASAVFPVQGPVTHLLQLS